MSTAIKIENLSKAYQIGQFSTGTLSKDLERLWANMRGKEDPFLRVGETNDRSVKGQSDIVWSLRDISFDINHGDSVGIIGRNGAGKSTLLKILSQVTSPTSGKVKVKGRIASLLEVGTGFHPELTGKENIFLNGAILGMTKNEIKRKYDEIVQFSGVQRYIDTPVKRYSSGMYVRLAFSVAAHLEPEILVVDEVLAVGDADFQKKCIGKMQDVTNEGRTIIFVSHNMASIRSLCTKSVYLKDGELIDYDETGSIISQYLSVASAGDTIDSQITDDSRLHGTGEAKFKNLVVSGTDMTPKIDFYFHETLIVRLTLEVFEDVPDANISLYILNVFGEKIVLNSQSDLFKSLAIEKGLYEVIVEIDENLMPGRYSFGLSISHFHSGADIDYVENFMQFNVSKESNFKGLDYPWGTVHGFVHAKSNWKISKIE